MTPKEKALELVSKFCGISLRLSTLNVIVDGIRVRLAKDSSLFLVDEIINSHQLENYFEKKEINSLESTSDDTYIYENIMNYWGKVKQEIEKL